jgi:hypothetical protein
MKHLAFGLCMAAVCSAAVLNLPSSFDSVRDLEQIIFGGTW